MIASHWDILFTKVGNILIFSFSRFKGASIVKRHVLLRVNRFKVKKATFVFNEETPQT